MAEAAVKVKNIKKLTKKQVRQEISTRLAGALEDYREKLGEKKLQ